ncbi:TLD-domain-containing protein [Roridomyces roridus]|uniref:Oxidation resistance protein 1 n=1 Tax=Roridomyces roridus TaxID=1738132 RepID=A0AAD7B1V1_9AGAR|nr:TLD-domain-containing protein [Roridomyces roridus]
MSDSPINTIPVLVPTKLGSARPVTPAPTRAEPDREAEAAFDKFSTLFLPPTPRASPLDPLFLPPESEPQVQSAAPISPDSEFGAFVSVPSAQDPLARLTPDPFGEPAQTKTETRPGHLRTASQTFFDQFSQSAKDRTETKRVLLDELLMHEDDPLYWLKDEPETIPPPPPPEDDLLPSEKPNKYLTDSLSDLDFDFFTSSQATPHRRSSSSSSHIRSPMRSPTLTLAPTLAPPIASSSTSADAPGYKFHSTARSGSYGSLASLSKSSGVKWVASFLPSANNHPNMSLSPASSASSSLSNSLTMPHHASTAPAGFTPEISHFTPFAPTSGGGYSAPTGAPGFRGGASYDWDRGFSHALERDLGVAPPPPRAAVPYSDFEEEEDEDVIVLGPNGGYRMPAKPKPSPEGQKEGVGVLLEKKMNGSIELVGRKEGTTAVLTPGLVALIHSHLPALLRLPRQWTLFYSLDQHGISLNTLYSRCAPPISTRTPHPKGALVVIQDAAGVMFGAWVADGLKRSSHGSYYGGGDSFLWRFVPSSGKFDVYKWTGKNDYVALCEDGYISFGGGDGHYGLYLDDTLFDGSSARCPTFDNEPLCSGATGKGGNGNVNFECVGLEVWGVGP